MPSFVPKRLPDGRALLNLGCGWKTHRGWNNLDFSPYAKLVSKPWLVKGLGAIGVLNQERKQRLSRIDPGILCWDLRHGIPFPDGTFDAVYHSHFLEHLDRSVAPAVLRECGRVLKPGGIVRVVIPDWEWLTNRYLEAVQAVNQRNSEARRRHETAMHDLIDQMVRTDATGAGRSGFGARFERWWRGGASKTGETHRWMYDRYSLAWLLEETGFRDIQVETATRSRIQAWDEFRLDLDDGGNIYKPESLYMEATQ